MVSSVQRRGMAVLHNVEAAAWPAGRDGAAERRGTLLDSEGEERVYVSGATQRLLVRDVIWIPPPASLSPRKVRDVFRIPPPSQRLCIRYT